MKILLVNKYFYIKGGPENSFFETAKLLENKGHKIVFFSMIHEKNFPSEYQQYFVSNIDYGDAGIANIFKASFRLLYSMEAKNKILKLIKKERPDIAHLNNIYHQISPSILHSIKKFNIPVIMTLRDYKMVCASYSLLAGGKVCEACRNGKYYNCFLKACVKNSRAKSLLNTMEMYLHHDILQIYNLVDIFISPSIFLKSKLEEMGFKKKIVHLPNFVDIAKSEPEYTWKENSIVYLGRLSKEKGLPALIDAVKHIKEIRLKIIGEGPMKSCLEEQVNKKRIKNVSFLGYKNSEDLKSEIAKSMFSILPSECYENNPRSVIESFALGKPVIGARIGGMPELIKDGKTGLTFEPGDPSDLNAKIKYLLNNPEQIVAMGKTARAFVEQELNAEKHYKKLMEIYNEAMSQK